MRQATTTAEVEATFAKAERPLRPGEADLIASNVNYWRSLDLAIKAAHMGGLDDLNMLLTRYEVALDKAASAQRVAA